MLSVTLWLPRFPERGRGGDPAQEGGKRKSTALLSARRGIFDVQEKVNIDLAGCRDRIRLGDQRRLSTCPVHFFLNLTFAIRSRMKHFYDGMQQQAFGLSQALISTPFKPPQQRYTSLTHAEHSVAVLS